MGGKRWQSLSKRTLCWYTGYNDARQMNGLEVCRRIRQTSTVPIIILTALGDEADKIAALNQGADDYLTKPFARRRTVGTGTGGPATCQLGRYSSLGRYPAFWRISRLILSSDRFGATVSASNSPRQSSVCCKSWHCIPAKIFTHETLLRRVWGTEHSRDAEYLRVYIGRLRRKIEIDSSKPLHILTEPGIGYYLVK